MPRRAEQVLSVAAMRAAEEALMGAGTSVHELMQRAGRGAADYIWRMAAHRSVTVLCGPGNNGGDGYVIAEAIRERGGKVCVIAASEAMTDAAKTARDLYRGDVAGAGHESSGDVLVDCLVGSGLTRPLTPDHQGLLQRLAARHQQAVAIDLPSGIEADSGIPLNSGLPDYDLTIALGAWKFAHFLMPAMAKLGTLRLVEIGVLPVPGAAGVIERPVLPVPACDAHKYRRGLLAVVSGDMPGASVLAAKAAQGAGAGYVKLLASGTPPVPADLVADHSPLAEVLADKRLAAVLAGPGLGRSSEARERLAVALAAGHPCVLDADALMLLGSRQIAERQAPLIATPHEGELQQLEATFGCDGHGCKADRAQALAKRSGMIVVAKGPDTVIAAPDGRMALAQRASSWLSVAGTGDVLAGTIASRLASGADAFDAACQGVWLHGEAARLCGNRPFSASALARLVPRAYAAAL